MGWYRENARDLPWFLPYISGQLSFLKHRISPAMAKASPTRLIKSEGRLSMMGSQGESGAYSISISANRISAIPCN